MYMLRGYTRAESIANRSVYHRHAYVTISSTVTSFMKYVHNGVVLMLLIGFYKKYMGAYLN